MLHQSLGDTAVQVCLAIFFAGKGIEDAERCRRELERKPDRRSRPLASHMR